MWSLTERTGRWGFAGYGLLAGTMIGFAQMLYSLAQMHDKPTALITLLFWIVKGAGLWLGFAAFVRRLHDVGWSGWWALLGPVPVAGWIQGIVLCSMPGQRAANKYGAPPGQARRASIDLGLEPVPTQSIARTA